MPGVSDLSPRPALDNIPHMLRRLAQVMDATGHTDVESVVLVMVRGGDKKPTVYQYGKESSRLQTVGALNQALINLLRSEP